MELKVFYQGEGDGEWTNLKFLDNVRGFAHIPSPKINFFLSALEWIML